MVQPAFHRQRINAYAETMTDFTERALRKWGDGETRDEAMLMVAMIAQRFDLELAPNQRITPQPSITMRPKYGLKMKVTAL